MSLDKYWLELIENNFANTTLNTNNNSNFNMINDSLPDAYVRFGSWANKNLLNTSLSILNSAFQMDENL